MSFEKEKLDFLSKKDKSWKGSVDSDIKDLIDFINSKENYYTTSSCSGRIILLVRKNETKQDSQWLYYSHSEVDFETVKSKLENLPEYPIWFKQEPAIFHICCRTIEDAQLIVDIARYVGFKRSGIQSTRKKILVEVNSAQVIDTLIAGEGNLYINNDYLRILIRESNKKLSNNKKRINRFFEELKEKIN